MQVNQSVTPATFDGRQKGSR